MAEKTTIFVADALAKALAASLWIVALGNNNSSCGDYRIEPGGSYLAATRETVRRLVGAERLDPDFDETYKAGGYYAARHPTVANTLIVVLNDILWSTKYPGRLRDGRTRRRTGHARLAARPVGAATRGRRTHLDGASHPVGDRCYSTIDAKASSCPAKVASFLKEPFASEFLALLVEHRDMLQASFSGHTHYDDYRVLIDARGTVVGADKVSPAISPVFGAEVQAFSCSPMTDRPVRPQTSRPGISPILAPHRMPLTGGSNTPSPRPMGRRSTRLTRSRLYGWRCPATAPYRILIGGSTWSDAARLMALSSRPIRAPWAMWTDGPSPRAIAEIAARPGPQSYAATLLSARPRRPAPSRRTSRRS